MRSGLTPRPVGAKVKPRYPIWSPTPSRGFLSQPGTTARPRLAPFGSHKTLPGTCSSPGIPDQGLRLYTIVWPLCKMRAQPRQLPIGMRLGLAVIRSFPPANATLEALESFEDHSGDHAKP